MNQKKLVDTAMLAGGIMMSSGAETYRVEDTVKRILLMSGYEGIEVFVVATGIIVTLDDFNEESITKLNRVKERNTNLTNIVEVNEISRKICNEDVSIDEAYEYLRNLEKTIFYKEKTIYIATILTIVAFAVLFGGSINDIIICTLNGILIVFCTIILKNMHFGNFVIQMTSCMLFVLLTLFLRKIFHGDANIGIIISSSAITFLPGVAFTNAIRDTFHGDYISGGSRIVESIVVAISIAAGVGIGLIIGKLFI